MKNEKLLQRICHLIALNYAIDVDKVYQIFLMTRSIDETIHTVQNNQTDIILKELRNE